MSPNSNRPRMRVALLRGDDHHNLYLDSLLRREFDVVTVISEPGLAQRRALRRRGKWCDAIAAEYHLLRRGIMGLNRRRGRFFADARTQASLPLPPFAHLTVTSVNDPSVAELVRASGADVCVITCTTTLSTRTVEAIGIDIINVHGGHLPNYRGCHCFFFALSNGDFDKIGSTIHFVNAGIDTGADRAGGTTVDRATR
jgi:methionyl-tRNA formyltransferase